MLALRSIPAATDDEAIARFSDTIPGWRIEYDTDGALLVSPTYSDGGPRELEAASQLLAFARTAGGKVFSSSSGFRLPDGSLRSPDASWVCAGRYDALDPAGRTKFWRICPDVVIEICSESDDWDELRAKLEMYERNGARYAVGIDPYERRVFERGTPPTGLILDFDRIIAA